MGRCLPPSVGQERPTIRQSDPIPHVVFVSVLDPPTAVHNTAQSFLPRVINDVQVTALGPPLRRTVTRKQPPPLFPLLSYFAFASLPTHQAHEGPMGKMTWLPGELIGRLMARRVQGVREETGQTR